jgi:hypothetical protein
MTASIALTANAKALRIAIVAPPELSSPRAPFLSKNYWRILPRRKPARARSPFAPAGLGMKYSSVIEMSLWRGPYAPCAATL